MIIDTGGGTVDLSTYVFTQKSPLKVSEIASPDCLLSLMLPQKHISNVREGIFQGSVIVSRRAELHLKGLSASG